MKKKKKPTNAWVSSAETDLDWGVTWALEFLKLPRRTQSEDKVENQCFTSVYPVIWASLVAQAVKNLPSVQETWVRSLGWEGLLEEGMATHSSILAWKSPMYRGAWWATLHRVAESQT